MKGFFIKKAFFDGWDNLIPIVLINIVYLVILYLCYLVFFTFPGIGLLAMVAFLFLFALVMGAGAAAVNNYADYKGDTWHALRTGFVRNIRHSVLYAFGLILAVMNVFLLIPFYLAYENAFGIGIAIILIWIEIFLILCMPFFFPLMNRLPADRPLKTAKKCLIIVGDNFGFTIFFLIYNIICIVLSFFTLGIIPGITGLQLAAEDAIKLLMLKYDWLEEHPEANRKDIPWDELLYDEKEKVGPRSLKSMIFPWK